MSTQRAGSVDDSYSFGDLVDITAFSRLLQSFTKATGIPGGLVGPHGELITQAGWLDACKLFHKATPETNRQCQESNIELMGMARDGEIVCRLCENGLNDYATPLVIEGHQLATLFLGRVLDAPPDLEFFRNRARRFGFDEEAYLRAIRAVPVVSKARMQAHMEYMVGVVQILAANGLARFREIKLQSDLNRSTERCIQMEDLLEFSPVGICWCDAEGKIEYVNRQFTEMFGYTLDDLPDIETWLGKAYPVAGYRASVVEPWLRQVDEARQSGLAPSKLESNIISKDGRTLRVMTQVGLVGEKRLANFTDITARWQSEQRNRVHNAMLEMVAKAAPLSDILHAVVGAIEEEAPASLCSVQLLDDEGKHLYTCAAPSLPLFFTQELDALEIGMGMDSCATSGHLGERVVVEKISTHECGRSFVELAKRAGLAACWAEPILASDGKVLGSFNVYHTEPAAPNETDMERISFAANLAAIAIENRNTRETLVRRERVFRTLAENSPINIARYDLDGRLVYLNPRLSAALSEPTEQLLGKKFSERSEVPGLEIRRRAFIQTAQSGQECSFEAEVPVRGAGTETHLIHMVPERDASGAVVGVLATGLDISELKRLQGELERQARFDDLTGLFNRRHFIELTGKELSRLRRYGGELSLIMFDIDFFKRINDTYGHHVGDMTLRKIAQISRETLREIDIVGRLGGEEFVVLLPQTNWQQAAEAAERLRLALDAGEVKLENGMALHFTASLGVLSVEDGADRQGETISVDDLLTRVDIALYQAKESGRNRVCLSQDFQGSGKTTARRPG
ncbi:MAG: diguanylate cyclase [Chromatiales bacterium]|jgi:diguanylate cyclase (GGDEF)-like protein/PAS domain S-box-containing protein